MLNIQGTNWVFVPRNEEKTNRLCQTQFHGNCPPALQNFINSNTKSTMTGAAAGAGKIIVHDCRGKHAFHIST